MRGQVMLLAALIIAMAIAAVVMLQSVAASAPGYGGVRAAYGVFSRDMSRAVEAIASYLDYVGAVSLINYTESSARYAMLAMACGDAYGRWFHVNATAAMVNASMLFFVLNRAALGLSAELPGPPRYSGGALAFRSGGGLTAVRLVLSRPPNGTLLDERSPLWEYVVEAVHYDRDGAPRRVSLFRVVLPNRTYTALYRISAVLNVSMLAIEGLNATRLFGVTVRVLNGTDSNCPEGAVCVNVTASRPYAWAARFEALNRTVEYDGESGAARIYYTPLSVEPPYVTLVNYTERSAVYRLNVSALNLVEYAIKVYVSNVPLYLPPRLARDVPLLYYNVTECELQSAPQNATKITVRACGRAVTYWVVHRGGTLPPGDCIRGLYP
jgi:hypothetical protein